MWKLEGNKLKNKADLWNSDDAWSLEKKNMLVYVVKNIESNKVLGVKRPVDKQMKVIQQDFEEDNFYGSDQLWKKGDPNAEGYFILEHYVLRRTLTAISTNSLEIKGKNLS